MRNYPSHIHTSPHPDGPQRLTELRDIDFFSVDRNDPTKKYIIKYEEDPDKAGRFWKLVEFHEEDPIGTQVRPRDASGGEMPTGTPFVAERWVINVGGDLGGSFGIVGIGDHIYRNGSTFEIIKLNKYIFVWKSSEPFSDFYTDNEIETLNSPRIYLEDDAGTNEWIVDTGTYSLENCTIIGSGENNYITGSGENSIIISKGTIFTKFFKSSKEVKFVSQLENGEKLFTVTEDYEMYCENVKFTKTDEGMYFYLDGGDLTINGDYSFINAGLEGEKIDNLNIVLKAIEGKTVLNVFRGVFDENTIEMENTIKAYPGQESIQEPIFKTQNGISRIFFVGNIKSMSPEIEPISGNFILNIGKGGTLVLPYNISADDLYDEIRSLTSNIIGVTGDHTTGWTLEWVASSPWDASGYMDLDMPYFEATTVNSLTPFFLNAGPNVVFEFDQLGSSDTDPSCYFLDNNSNGSNIDIKTIIPTESRYYVKATDDLIELVTTDDVRFRGTFTEGKKVTIVNNTSGVANIQYDGGIKSLTKDFFVDMYYNNGAWKILRTASNNPISGIIKRDNEVSFYSIYTGYSLGSMDKDINQYIYLSDNATHYIGNEQLYNLEHLVFVGSSQGGSKIEIHNTADITGQINIENDVEVVYGGTADLLVDNFPITNIGSQSKIVSENGNLLNLINEHKVFMKDNSILDANINLSKRIFTEKEEIDGVGYAEFPVVIPVGEDYYMLTVKTPTNTLGNGRINLLKKDGDSWISVFEHGPEEPLKSYDMFFDGDDIWLYFEEYFSHNQYVVKYNVDLGTAIYVGTLPTLPSGYGDKKIWKDSNGDILTFTYRVGQPNSVYISRYNELEPTLRTTGTRSMTGVGELPFDMGDDGYMYVKGLDGEGGRGGVYCIKGDTGSSNPLFIPTGAETPRTLQPLYTKGNTAIRVIDENNITIVEIVSDTETIKTVWNGATNTETSIPSTINNYDFWNYMIKYNGDIYHLGRDGFSSPRLYDMYFFDDTEWVKLVEGWEPDYGTYIVLRMPFNMDLYNINGDMVFYGYLYQPYNSIYSQLQEFRFSQGKLVVDMVDNAHIDLSKITCGHLNSVHIKHAFESTWNDIDPGIFNGEITFEPKYDSTLLSSSILEGTGSPVGVILPRFKGDTYLDTDGPTFYRSHGLTNLDWIL